MTLDDALNALEELAEPGRAEQMLAYHKVPRRYIGIGNAATNDLVKGWRQSLDVETRIALADGLWKTDIYEARLAAAKLLEQARLKPDDAAWQLIASWHVDFDSWAIADHVCISGAKRLVADPSRIGEVETWTTSEHMWTRRAALVMTLPWTKMNNPKPADIEVRERVLGWAASYVPDHTWFIQKSISWWLRELSKHDADRVRLFLSEHGEAMKPFARKDAARKLPPL